MQKGELSIEDEGSLVLDDLALILRERRFADGESCATSGDSEGEGGGEGVRRTIVSRCFLFLLGRTLDGGAKLGSRSDSSWSRLRFFEPFLSASSLCLRCFFFAGLSRTGDSVDILAALKASPAAAGIAKGDWKFCAAFPGVRFVSAVADRLGVRRVPLVA